MSKIFNSSTDTNTQTHRHTDARTLSIIKKHTYTLVNVYIHAYMSSYNEELKRLSRLRENIIEDVSKIIISLLNSILHRTPDYGSLVAGKHKFIRKNEEPQFIRLSRELNVILYGGHKMPHSPCRNNLKECRGLHLWPAWMQEGLYSSFLALLT